MASPLAQLGVVLTVYHILEDLGAQLPFSSLSYSWFPLAEAGAKRVVVQEFKFFTHTAEF